MAKKPTYEELEQRVKEFEKEAFKRKQAEEALRESEKKYRQFFATVSDAMMIFDSDTREFIDANDAVSSLYGYSKEEFLKLKHTDITAEPEKSHESIIQTINGEISSIPLRYHKHKDGTIFPVEISTGTFKLADRQMVCGMVRDITERKLAEEALLRTTKLLDLIRKAQSLYIASADSRSVFKLLLNTLIEITESEYGFLDEILHDRDGSIYKLNLAISDISWDEESRQLYQQLQARNLEFRNLNNLSGLPALTGEYLISNNPADDPRSGGLPKGHPPIKTFMGMPLYFGQKLVGIAGVANREGGYTKDMTDFLEPLLTTCASITAAFRHEALEKERDRALQQSEERFRTLVEQAADAFFLHDSEGRIIDVNQRSCESLGYSREELLSMSMADIDIEFKTHNHQKQFWEQLAPGQPVTFEGVHRRKDGSAFTVEVRLGLLEIGSQTLMLGLARDITKQKMAKLALRESEARYRSIFEKIIEGIFQTTPDGRLLIANPALARIAGFDSPQELIDHVKDLSTDLYVDPDRRKELVCLMERDGFVNKFEAELQRKDGSIAIVSINAHAVLDADGQIQYIEGTLEDITERKRAEKEKMKLLSQLQQAQKMEAIGTLAGGIAHDFNNILTPIMGFAEMVIDDVPKNSPLRNNIREILQGAKRARDLVKQILALSRQSEQQSKPLKVQHVVKEVLKLIRSSIPTTISIKQDINSQCGLVMADASQVHQVCMNLMTNAYHALEEEGGVIEVTLEEVELTADDLTDPSMAPGTYVRLTVSDTGTGIEPHTLDKIFEPYFTTKANGKGTGLGLAVVHGIVKSFNGDIIVYSDPGKGSTFHVYLPVITLQSETEETEAIEPVPKGKERILLVDDEEPIVRLQKQMLERLGYEVTERTSSIEALGVFRANSNNFDLVITDMTMPNMTGIELARKLQEIRPDILIIICTGFSEKIDDQKAKAFGIRGFVMKPVVKSELAKKIREVLDKD